MGYLAAINCTVILWNNLDRSTKLCVFKLQSVLQCFTIHLVEKNVFGKKIVYGFKYAFYDSFIVGEFFFVTSPISI